MNRESTRRDTTAEAVLQADSREASASEKSVRCDVQ